MGRGPDRDEAELLVFDADAPPTHPIRGIRPVAAGRRRGSSRGIGLAVAALAILTAGIAVGGMLESPGPDGNTPTRDPFATAAVCTPMDYSRVPTFSLFIERLERTIDGLAGHMYLPGGETGPRGWQIPPAGSARAPIITTTDALELRVGSGECIRHLMADLAPASVANPGQYDFVPVANHEVSPANPEPGLGALPEGDWVLRVTATFENGASSSVGPVWGTRFFRVRVGDGPFASRPPRPTPDPNPTPAPPPAVPCGETPTTAETIRVDLTAPGSEPVPGVAEGLEVPDVSVGLGDDFEIAIAGDACALSWTISLFEAQTGAAIAADAMDNPDDRPDFASQNRWRFNMSLGTLDVVATLHFGPDLDIVRFWRVVGEGFRVPDVVLTAEDGASVTAAPSCGLTVELSNGYSIGDECAEITVPDPLPVLHVAAWSLVSLDIPGWTIVSWNGQCVREIPDGGGLGSNFDWLCSLGGFYEDFSVEPPGPAQFLARPGDQLLQLWVQGRSDAGMFSTQLFVRVVGE